MKNPIVKAMGWLTVPGIMYSMLKDEPHKPITSRHDLKIVLVLSAIALMVYVAAGIFFGNPMFRASLLEILSLLAGLAMVPNLIILLLGMTVLFEEKQEVPTNTAD